jgi:hypothetical protein
MGLKQRPDSLQVRTPGLDFNVQVGHFGLRIERPFPFVSLRGAQRRGNLFRIAPKKAL